MMKQTLYIVDDSTDPQIDHEIRDQVAEYLQKKLSEQIERTFMCDCAYQGNTASNVFEPGRGVYIRNMVS